MNRSPSRYAAILLAAGLAALLDGCTETKTHAAGNPEVVPQQPDVLLACAGRVEGRSDTVEVGAAIDGLIEHVFVREGERVAEGTRLASIACPDLQASLQEAQSQAESARQVRARLLRGARDEERQMATERTKAAKSILQRAITNLERMKSLYTKNDVSQSSVDDAQRDYDVAQANLNEAMRHEQMVNAPPLEEDVAKATADVKVAEDRIEVIKNRITRCTVTAPMNGTILTILMRPGESFSTLAPRPLFRIADISARRVRAEVDERDALNVRVGQRVLVFPEGREQHKFTGKVGQIAFAMGRKKVLTGDPAEKTDHDILEAMIGLESKALSLPVGMRVVVQFLR